MPASNPTLRIAAFNVLPPLFGLVTGWAAQAGHKIVLVVTSPGPKSRRSEGYKHIVAQAGELNLEVLVTTRLKTVATPMLRELKPDLILSASFPWLLPPELLQTARLGAVNLHPSLLPAYRGPNPMRQFYEASPQVGATLHWTEAEFDTGHILAQHAVPLPRPCTPETIRATWAPTMMAAIVEGTARAIAGDAGRAQPTTGISYGAEFTEAEHWLDMAEPAFALQCKAAALNMLGAPSAKTRINGEPWLIARIELLTNATSATAPGSIIEHLDDGLIVQAGDAPIKLTATRLSQINA